MTEPLSVHEYETRIRERAEQLWEAAGRPEGQDQHFWYAAQAQFEAERPEQAPRHAADPVPEHPEDANLMLSDIV